MKKSLRDAVPFLFRRVLLALLFFLCPGIGTGLAEEQPGTITTVAGNFPGDGGLATNALISLPPDIAVDGPGHVYIADAHRIRRIDATTGIITTIAGTGERGFSGDGGPATAAQIFGPVSVAQDAAGNIYFGDSGNRRVRRVDAATGIITTIAGNGVLGFSGDGGPATEAQLRSPRGLALNGAGNLYINDSNQRIRRVDATTGIITTVAGTGVSGFSGDGGLATAASLNFPSDVTVNEAGNIYIADTGNHRIRRVDTVSGIITTVAGNGQFGFLGDGSPATSARLFSPEAVAFDGVGHLYIFDRGNNRIRRVEASTGIITTIVGSGEAGFSGDGDSATAAKLALNPGHGIGLNETGDLYFTDTSNFRIRRVEAATGIIATIAGVGDRSFSGDEGLATFALLNSPSDVTVDETGNFYISDTGNYRVRRVDALTGIIATIVGTGSQGFSGDGGLAATAEISSPLSITVDGAGNLHIADSGNNRIRRVDAATGIITTIAGIGSPGFSGDGGQATAAELWTPTDMAFDGSGNLYIADGDNYRIRRIDAATGIISTIAGTGIPGFPSEGVPATEADIGFPQSIALDRSDNIYIVDTDNVCIHRVDAITGFIDRFAGIGGGGNFGDFVDGVDRMEAALLRPVSVALDKVDNLYITDFENLRVFIVDAVTGIIRTIAGTELSGFSGDGGPATASRLSNDARGIALDAAGNLYIADAGNHRIRRVASGIPIPEGTDVVVRPVDTATGTAPADLTFSTVSQSGSTSLTTSDTGTTPPSGFALGDPPTYYDLTTTAVFSGPVTVCIDYTGVSFTNESELKVFHFENEAWVDRTVSLDTVNNIICAVVDSLSPFAIFETSAPADSDGDGVLDEDDLCPATPSDASINADGCSGPQFVALACPGPAFFPNHGKFVSCIAHAANDAVAQGLISPQEKAQFVRNAAQGD